MRSFVVIVFFYLLVVVITSVQRDASPAAAASSSSSLVFLPGRRALAKRSISYQSKQGNDKLKGFSFGSTQQAAGRGLKSTKPENSEAYSTESQNSSNMDVESIIYHIDYQGATTHPTPTPKHPNP